MHWVTLFEFDNASVLIVTISCDRCINYKSLGIIYRWAFDLVIYAVCSLQVFFAERSCQNLAGRVEVLTLSDFSADYPRFTYFYPYACEFIDMGFFVLLPR